MPSTTQLRYDTSLAKYTDLADLQRPVEGAEPGEGWERPAVLVPSERGDR